MPHFQNFKYNLWNGNRLWGGHTLTLRVQVVHDLLALIQVQVLLYVKYSQKETTKLPVKRAICKCEWLDIYHSNP